MKYLTWNIIFLCLAIISQAQEFNCNVQINTPQLQTTDPKVFRTLETSIREFLNGTRWSDDYFEPHERIDVSININITKELSANSFEAEFFLQATRPIYGSSQQTVVLEHADNDFAFQYAEFDPLEFSENTFTSNLTSFLAFYSYLILGLDYDSFSYLGGTPYFQKAQDIVNTVPPSAASQYPGWSSLDGQRNRYWAIESILSPRAKPLREAMYEYHIKGMDVFSDNAELARAGIMGAMNKVKQVYENYPNAMFTQMFVNAKGDELASIFSRGTSDEKRDVYNIMIKIDAANASKYRAMRRF